MKSLAFGVLLALVAQAVYEGLIDAIMGRKTEAGAVTVALVISVIVLLLFFYIFDFFGNSPYVTHRKKEEPKS